MSKNQDKVKKGKFDIYGDGDFDNILDEAQTAVDDEINKRKKLRNNNINSIINNSLNNMNNNSIQFGSPDNDDYYNQNYNILDTQGSNNLENNFLKLSSNNNINNNNTNISFANTNNNNTINKSINNTLNENNKSVNFKDELNNWNMYDSEGNTLAENDIVKYNPQAYQEIQKVKELKTKIAKNQLENKEDEVPGFQKVGKTDINNKDLAEKDENKDNRKENNDANYSSINFNNFYDTNNNFGTSNNINNILNESFDDFPINNPIKESMMMNEKELLDYQTNFIIDSNDIKDKTDLSEININNTTSNAINNKSTVYVNPELFDPYGDEINDDNNVKEDNKKISKAALLSEINKNKEEFEKALDKKEKFHNNNFYLQNNNRSINKKDISNTQITVSGNNDLNINIFDFQKNSKASLQGKRISGLSSEIINESLGIIKGINDIITNNNEDNNNKDDNESIYLKAHVKKYTKGFNKKAVSISNIIKTDQSTLIKPTNNTNNAISLNLPIQNIVSENNTINNNNSYSMKDVNPTIIETQNTIIMPNNYDISHNNILNDDNIKAQSFVSSNTKITYQKKFGGIPVLNNNININNNSKSSYNTPISIENKINKRVYTKIHSKSNFNNTNNSINSINTINSKVNNSLNKAFQNLNDDAKFDFEIEDNYVKDNSANNSISVNDSRNYNKSYSKQKSMNSLSNVNYNNNVDGNIKNENSIRKDSKKVSTSNKINFDLDDFEISAVTNSNINTTGIKAKNANKSDKPIVINSNNAQIPKNSITKPILNKDFKDAHSNNIKSDFDFDNSIDKGNTIEDNNKIIKNDNKSKISTTIKEENTTKIKQLNYLFDNKNKKVAKNNNSINMSINNSINNSFFKDPNNIDNNPYNNNHDSFIVNDSIAQNYINNSFANNPNTINYNFKNDNNPIIKKPNSSFVFNNDEEDEFDQVIKKQSVKDNIKNKNSFNDIRISNYNKRLSRKNEEIHDNSNNNIDDDINYNVIKDIKINKNNEVVFSIKTNNNNKILKPDSTNTPYNNNNTNNNMIKKELENSNIHVDSDGLGSDGDDDELFRINKNNNADKIGSTNIINSSVDIKNETQNEKNQVKSKSLIDDWDFGEDMVNTNKALPIKENQKKIENKELMKSKEKENEIKPNNTFNADKTKTIEEFAFDNSTPLFDFQKKPKIWAKKEVKIPDLVELTNKNINNNKDSQDNHTSSKNIILNENDILFNQESYNIKDKISEHISSNQLPKLHKHMKNNNISNSNDSKSIDFEFQDSFGKSKNNLFNNLNENEKIFSNSNNKDINKNNISNGINFKESKEFLNSINSNDSIDSYLKRNNKIEKYSTLDNNNKENEVKILDINQSITSDIKKGAIGMFNTKTIKNNYNNDSYNENENDINEFSNYGNDSIRNAAANMFNESENNNDIYKEDNSENAKDEETVVVNNSLINNLTEDW